MAGLAVLSLIGFRNRVAVFLEWAWSYVTWQRGARLITGEVSPDLRPEGYHAHELMPAEHVHAAAAAGNRAAGDERGWMGGDASQAAASDVARKG